MSAARERTITVQVEKLPAEKTEADGHATAGS